MNPWSQETESFFPFLLTMTNPTVSDNIETKKIDFESINAMRKIPTLPVDSKKNNQ